LSSGFCSSSADAALEHIEMTVRIERDRFRVKINAYLDLYNAAAITRDRYSRSEVKYVRCVDTVRLQERINSLSKRYRELDTGIQGMNRTTELAE
jgi:hypothetical protein